MIENTPIRTAIAHLVLVLGILIVAFPIYYTFVASTHSLQTILRPPLPLLPGDRFVENYSTALFGGVGRIGGVGVGTAAVEHHVVALGDRRRQDRHLDPVGLRHRVLPLPVPDGLLLADLHHADAAGRGAHPADLQGDGRSRPDRHLYRPDAAADGVGHRDACCSASSS